MSELDIQALIAPAIDGVVVALSDRGDPNPALRRARADAAKTLILAFQPRDPVALILSGQAVMHHELLADTARDVLCGLHGADKRRALSAVVALSRVLLGHVDRLEKRDSRPPRGAEATADAALAVAPPAATPAVAPPIAGVFPTASVAEPEMVLPEVAAAEAATAEGATAEVATAVPAGPAAVADEPSPPLATRAAPPATGGLHRRGQVAETSWLDEPWEQWVIETPADLARAAALARDSAAATASPSIATIAEAVALFDQARDAAGGVPRPAAGYPPARALADAADDFASISE